MYVHEIFLIFPVVRKDYHKIPVDVARFLVTFGYLVDLWAFFGNQIQCSFDYLYGDSLVFVISCQAKNVNCLTKNTNLRTATFLL